MSQPEDRIRVVRLLVYEGPRADVEKQISNSLSHCQIFCAKSVSIQVFTLGGFPEIITTGALDVITAYGEGRDAAIDNAVSVAQTYDAPKALIDSINKLKQ